MGDILELIQTRRNVKYFLPKFVSWDNVARILDAARHAPSCGNIQNWKFVVVFDPDKKHQIAEACYGQYEIVQAGILIVVCAEPEKAERYYGVRGERLYSVQNCAAAIQNMLLEAHSLGLATCWIGGFEEESVKSTLNIPEDARPQAIIAVGYAKEVPAKPPKYPLEPIVYFNGWRARLRDPAKYMVDTATILARKAGMVTELARDAKQSVVDKIKDRISKKEE